MNSLATRHISLFILLLICFSTDSSMAVAPSYTGYYLSDQDDPAIMNQTLNTYAGPNQELVKDPFEKINRVTFEINMFLDTAILEPVNIVYTTIIPTPGRKHISAFTKNLGTPITFANDLLQGNLENASVSFWRFIINSFLGFGGIMDIASEAGLQYHNEDFGQTLAFHGVPPGPYLVLPLVGPATTRDVVGRAVDYFADPFRAEFGNKAKQELSYIRALNKRAERDQTIKHIKYDSLDPYTSMKSLYIQNRYSQIRNRGN